MSADFPQGSQGQTSSTSTASVQPPALPPIESDNLPPIYANFARVGSNPEELVLDFGLNTNPPGATAAPIRLTQRLVLNYFTAKRLWGALGLAIQRHEQAFGVVETEINKRLKPTAPPAQR